MLDHRATPLASATATRAAEQSPQKEKQPYGLSGRKGLSLLVLGAIAGVVLTAVMVFYRPPGAGDARQQQALAAFQAGDFERVLDICPPPGAQSTPWVGCLLLRAHVMFAQGNLEDAGTLYGLASQSSHALKIESAEGLIGLGRIASIRNQYQQAMDHYQQASHAAPRDKEPLVALAVLNERLGKDQEALALIESAERVAPANDLTIATMRRSLSAKVALNNDTERMARIDRLIDELSRNASDARPSSPADQQDTHPAVVWVMDLESSGYSRQEGAPELMGAVIENRLHEKASLRIVDRHFMDRTLSELKLGSSALVDQQARLQLGRLLAVRLMITGRVVFAGAETQISLRCIDTETSRVAAVAVEAFANHLPLPDMARQAADRLMQQIDTDYL